MDTLTIEKPIENIQWANDKEYRRTFGSFPTGVTVITAVTPEGKHVGLTANSFTSVSMDPPMVLWSLASNSKLREVYCKCSHFAIHILSSDQEDISRRFCSPVEDRFEGLEYTTGAGNVPLLSGCSAVIECKRGDVVTWGDHDVISGIVERHAYTDINEEPNKVPLAFLAGKYGSFQAVNS